MPTLGEKRVRTEFNPSKDDVVSQIKQKSADLINQVNSLKQSRLADEEANHERNRLIALASTAFEEAAMWAVKAATV